MDVINQAWSPAYDLKNIFDVFLPQLLSYPNPMDPLNPGAASSLINEKEKYELKVKEYVQKYASDHTGQKSTGKERAEALVLRPKTAALNPEESDNEKISNISLSEVSELSDTSDLDIEGEICQYK